MKKLISFLSLILVSVLLTSCVDYVQAISYKNGTYQLYYKFTLSKVLFAMMDQDPEEIFGEINSDTEENLPNNARTRIINTDLEVGEEFYFEVNPKTTDETEKSFLPKVAGKKCYIPFLLGTNDSIKDEAETSDSESEAMAQAFLSSSKCRVMIGKNILKNIETAYFEGKGGQNYSIPVFDYGESYCLEIPFVILYGNNMLNLERIVIIQQ